MKCVADSVNAWSQPFKWLINTFILKYTFEWLRGRLHSIPRKLNFESVRISSAPSLLLFAVSLVDLIGSDGDTRQWCDTFWISCKAWSTWKRSKPEITAPDKYLKDQDNTSDLKLPLRFSSSNATFVIEITFEEGPSGRASGHGERLWRSHLLLSKWNELILAFGAKYRTNIHLKSKRVCLKQTETISVITNRLDWTALSIRYQYVTLNKCRFIFLYRKTTHFHPVRLLVFTKY